MSRLCAENNAPRQSSTIIGGTVTISFSFSFFSFPESEGETICSPRTKLRAAAF